MIPIEVRSQMGTHKSEIQKFAERRINFALDHLQKVRRISISIDDVNGPKGGVDKHCRIVAEVGTSSVVVLDETQPDWQSALARAIHRLDRNATQQSHRRSRTSYQRGHRTPTRSSMTQSDSTD